MHIISFSLFGVPERPKVQKLLNHCGSELSTTDVYVWRYTLLVVHATKEEDIVSNHSELYKHSKVV